MIFSARKAPPHVLDRRSPVCLWAPGRSAGRPFSGNVVTEFITPLPSLLPSYRLYFITTAGATGFKLFRFTDVRVDIDKTTRLDVTFQIGEVTESISVSEGGSARLETDTVSLGQIVNQKTIVDLPIARNFISLAAITAGVIPVTGENGQSLQTGFTNRGNLSAFVSGQRESSVSFLIDGVESRGERLGNASMPVSVDAIQQFSVQRNSMSAEYGNSTAVINVSVKSGSNDFHGTLFHFLQNSAFNARNFFDGDQKSQTRFNDFGGSVGGPLKRDRTFFFFNYEGVRTRRNDSLLGRFPTPAQLNGDFSSLPVPIYDPLTTNPATGERSPFPGNIIPPDRIDPVIRNLRRYIPAPNLAIPVNNNFNYRVSPSSKDDSDQHHIRIDHQLSSKDSLFGRWSSYDAFNNRPGIAPLYGQEFPWTTYNFALQETHTFGLRSLNEFRFGYSRDNIFQTPEGVPGVILAQEIGLRNTVTSPRDGGALPLFIVPGFSSIGGGRPTGYISNRFQFSDTFTITRGSHSVKLGADIRRLHYNVYSSNVPNGQVNFARSFTTQIGLADDEFVDNGNFPYKLYVREARRIEGAYLFTESDIHKDLRGNGIRGPLQKDSVAIGLYEMDSHNVSNPTDRNSPCSGEGAINLNDVTGPFQVPYGVIVPRDVEGLLVPVAVSATHVAFQSIRMEPVWSGLGQASGAAAALALQDKKEVRQVEVTKLQQHLLKRQCMLFFYRDLEPEAPGFASIQSMSLLGAIDGNENYDFRPGDPISMGEFARLVVKGLNLPLSITAAHFQDVPRSHPAFRYIETLYDMSTQLSEPFLKYEIRGYSTYRYRTGKMNPLVFAYPERSLKRRDLARILAGVFCFTQETPPSRAASNFRDVPANDLDAKSIQLLASLGVLSSYQNRFEPDAIVDRAEACRIICHFRKRLSRVSK